ncbi:MAG: rhamnogalacturonan acetylesterase [Lachnospiraceae bacterium]|nr:rhamnogalacturonan acetylesterase [Lachnospiraceae bacterium]
MKRIIYAGDSTVTYNRIDTYPQAGLSQGLLYYLNDEVFLRSFAVNGRSTKSFIDQGRLAVIDAYLKEGDIFLIQFGHNDEKKADESRYTEPFGSFKDNLRKFIATGRAHGAYPVLLTPIARRMFDEAGNFIPGSHGDYPAAMKETAKEEGVPVIDTTSLTENYLKAVGDHASRPMYIYPKDNSHLQIHGAVVYAGFIAQAMRKLGGPYAEVLSPEYASAQSLSSEGKLEEAFKVETED